MKCRATSSGVVLDFTGCVPVNEGGQGLIYEVAGQPSSLAKLYKRGSGASATKLKIMLINPPRRVSDDDGHTLIAWPTELLEEVNNRRRIVGFLMPKASAVKPLINVYNPLFRNKSASQFNYKYLLRTATNLAAAMKSLHDVGHIVGDVNESNAQVDKRALVTLVDTDSFQITDPVTRRVFPCPVGKPEFLPRETTVKKAGEHLEQPHDLFGLGVLVFQLLLEGTHPFSGEWLGSGESPTIPERIQAGHFPYSQRAKSFVRPMRSAPPIFIVSPEILSLFLRCFEEGHSNPNSRPTATEWQDALQRAETELVQCDARSQHYFRKQLGACPWCERTAALGGRDPFPSPKTKSPQPAPAPPTSRKPSPTPSPPPQHSPIPSFQFGAPKRIVPFLIAAAVVVALIYGASNSNSGDMTRATGPIVATTPAVESLLREQPRNIELWNRALAEWQSVQPRNAAAILGVVGIAQLLRGMRAPVEDESVVAALKVVGRTPSEFYAELADSAGATGSRAMAVAILDEGLRQWPTDRLLTVRRDSMQRIASGASAGVPTGTGTEDGTAAVNDASGRPADNAGPSPIASSPVRELGSLTVEAFYEVAIRVTGNGLDVRRMVGPNSSESARFELPQGSYQVTAIAPEVFLNYEATSTIVAQQNEPITLPLRVRALVYGASGDYQLFIDGRRIASPPFDGEITTGVHRFRFVWPDGERQFSAQVEGSVSISMGIGSEWTAPRIIRRPG